MKLLKRKNGSISIGSIIGIIVIALVAVTILPVLLTTLSASAGNFTASQYALLGLVPIGIIIAVVVGAFAMAKSRG